MSISFSPEFAPAELAAQKRLNRVLARLPRLGVVGPWRRAFVRAVLALGRTGADRRLRRRGFDVRMLDVVHRGRRLRLRRIARPGAVQRAILLDIHGGAWAFGSASMDDPLNASFADALDAVVVSLEYELALPRAVAALQADAAAALDWALCGGGSALPADVPVVLTGESAGGHLALSAMIACRDAPVGLSRLAGALLHYGAYDLGGSPSAIDAGPDTLLLHGPTLARQIETLFPGLSIDQRRDPALSPVFADLHGLPPALILVGDIDPLRDDSLLLADRLRAARNHVALAVLPCCPHGIIHMPGAYADRVRRTGRDWLRQRIAHPLHH